MTSLIAAPAIVRSAAWVRAPTALLLCAEVVSFDPRGALGVGTTLGDRAKLAPGLASFVALLSGALKYSAILDAVLSTGIVGTDLVDSPVDGPVWAARLTGERLCLVGDVDEGAVLALVQDHADIAACPAQAG